jgi:hypothetical protein
LKNARNPVITYRFRNKPEDREVRDESVHEMSWCINFIAFNISDKGEIQKLKEVKLKFRYAFLFTLMFATYLTRTTGGQGKQKRELLMNG